MKRNLSPIMIASAAALISGCDQATSAPAVQISAQVSGKGEPYQVPGTQVWSVPDPLDGRRYQVYVALPASYDSQPNRTYPVLYVTDAHYAFPIFRQLARRMNLDEPVIEEHILVGLSYAEGDAPNISRTRDYTPSARLGATAGTEGGGPAYQAWLKSSVLPFIETNFRADPQRRILQGHSFGSLLATQILLSEPEMFSGYLLGSPSLWFNNHQMFDREAAYAQSHSDLAADIFMYIGENEVPGPKGRYDMVGDNRRFKQALRSRNYPSLDLSSVVISDEDHLTVAPIGFMRGLEALLPAQ